MNVKKHHSATCRHCNTCLWYGAKSEPTMWKIVYACLPPEGCGWEETVGRISREDAKSLDDVFDRAEAMK